MQAVILAAGKGTRMRGLTETHPKPLLTVAGKKLLEHKLDTLPREIDEVILIIGYKGDMIKNYFGDVYKGKKLTYIEQKEMLGTGHAIWQAKDILNDHFISMMGDDIYDTSSIQKVMQYPFAIATKKVKGFKGAGHVTAKDDGYLKDIEFDHESKFDLINLDTGLYSLSKEFFDFDLVPLSEKKEYGLPHTLAAVAKKIPVKVVDADFWLKLNTPEDLAEAEKIFGGNLL